MTKQTTFDLNQYARDVCNKICKHHHQANVINMSGINTVSPYGRLFANYCVSCPLEAMMNLLREERDQNMKLSLEFEWEEV